MRATLLITLIVVAVTVVAAADNYVHTPSGRMRSDCVHAVPNNAVVTESSIAGEWLRVHSEDGRYIKTLFRCLDTVTRPLLESTLNKRKASIKLLTEDGASIIPIAPKVTRGDDPFPPDYDGWEAYTAYNHPSAGINSFIGNFSVPDSPDSVPDILYIFTGLQNVDWIPMRDPEVPGFDIIQPVLQYPADMGDGWSVKSWYVTLDDGALYTEELPLADGDIIFGNMTQTDSSGGWFIGSQSVQTGKSTNLNVSRPRLINQFWAYVTLECYGCVDCSTYPQNPSKFSGLSMSSKGQAITNPKFLLNPKPNPSLKCQETVDILSTTAQNIIFRTP